MTDSESEFSFSSEGSQENSQTEESKFPQSKRTKKRNFEDKHLISMDKARKIEKYTVGLKVRVSNSRSLDLEKRFIFYHAPSFLKK